MISQFLYTLKNNRLAHLLILAGSILIVYYGIWNNYFSSEDDFVWIGFMHPLGSFSEAVKGLGNGVRFLWFLRIWLLDRLFYLNATPYYWLGLFQHILLTFLAYWLVKFWTKKRGLAFLSAFLFGTKFSYFEVITSTSATGYTFWAVFYFLSLVLFMMYMEQRKLIHYLGSIVAYMLLSVGHDYTLHFPLLLIAYHLTLWRGSQPLSSLSWKDFRVYIPFFLIWAVHVSIQFFYIFQGTSEAVLSDMPYQPGLHMFTNLFYLVFLLIPNVHMAAINNFLNGIIGPTLIELIWELTIGLAILGGTVVVLAFWRGSVLVRFSLALIFIPFLQYLMWEGNYAGASRYLYIPSLGFSILLALLLFAINDRLLLNGKRRYEIIVPSIVFFIFAMNFIAIQTWVQQQVRNAHLRRAFVTQLASNYRFIEPGSEIYIEVPEVDYTDLVEACPLVFTQPVLCQSFISGEKSGEDIRPSIDSVSVYWLQATDKGIIQKYPIP